MERRTRGDRLPSNEVYDAEMELQYCPLHPLKNCVDDEDECKTDDVESRATQNDFCSVVEQLTTFAM